MKGRCLTQIELFGQKASYLKIQFRVKRRVFIWVRHTFSFAIIAKIKYPERILCYQDGFCACL
jgi:hypothetical protein